jgi:hypothetical protein
LDWSVPWQRWKRIWGIHCEIMTLTYCHYLAVIITLILSAWGVTLTMAILLLIHIHMSFHLIPMLDQSYDGSYIP